MSFFPVNRYWGETERSIDEAPKSSLQSLLQKIEERKRKRRAILLDAVVDEIAVADTKRSRRDDDISETNHDFDIDEEIAKQPTKFSDLRTDHDEHEFNSESSETVFKSDAKKEEATGEESNFTVLKSLNFSKTSKVKRVLPNWLANPSVVSCDLKNLSVGISDIAGLDDVLIKRLKKNNIKHFFPVQSQLIPWLLEYHVKCKHFWPRDICVSAPTGSGKTLAFVLPIIQILKKRFIPTIGALVVLPTNELAEQIYKVFREYVIGTDLNVAHLGGSMLEKERSQYFDKDDIHRYDDLIDIVVTTPGRLVEHLKYTKNFDLTHLKFLVIDEADHVMESTQNDWLHHLQSKIPPLSKTPNPPPLNLRTITKTPFRSQRLLFSATLSQDPEKLQNLSLFEPKLFTSVVCDGAKSGEVDATANASERGVFVGKYTTPDELTEYYAVCGSTTKPLAVHYLVTRHGWRRVLCFADATSSVHRLATVLRALGGERVVAEISGTLSRHERRDVLTRFADGSIDILVTTDSLARGMDIKCVKCVILYDVPKFAKNYIHRIGRTGRAGNEGTSLVLVTPDQKEQFQCILKNASKTNVQDIGLTISDLKPFEEAYKLALQNLQEEIQKEEKQNILRLKNVKRGMATNVRRRDSRRNKRNQNSIRRQI